MKTVYRFSASFSAVAICCALSFGQNDYRTQGGDILKNNCVWEGRGTNKIGGLSDHMFTNQKFDIIRFCIDMKKSVHSDSYLQNAVNKARAHDAVIILTAFWYDNQDLGGSVNWKPAQLLSSVPLNDSRYDTIESRWKEVAKLFKNQMDVWFGVWNEPYWWDGSHGYSEDQWLRDHRALTSAIRDQGANNIVVCQGSHMGQGHEVLINKGADLVSEFGNIVFDIHMYETRWTHSKDEIKRRIMEVRGKVPMMVGEFAIGNHHTHSTNWKAVIDACRETGTSCMYWLHGKEWDDRREYVFAYCRETRNTECSSSSEPVAPSIGSQPQSQSIEEGRTAAFAVQAQGHPLNYQWKRNGQAIQGATQAAYSFGPVSNDDDGASFTVTITNEKGSVTSDAARLTVKPFEGLQISHGTVAADGNFGEWESLEARGLEQVILGSSSGASDLGAQFKVMWNESNLYVMVDVTDNTLVNTAETDYENDCIELYIDGANSKFGSYGASDRQYRFIWDNDAIYEQGSHTAGVSFAQENTAGGYRMEIAIPWSSVGANPSNGDYIGFDIHVADNDGSGRKAKAAWAASEDVSWTDPSSFGTALLGDAGTTGNRRFGTGVYRGANWFVVRGNVLALTSLDQERHSARILDSSGKTLVHRSGLSGAASVALTQLPSGVYTLFITRGSITNRALIAIRK